ncbi:MAG: metal ABC transporter ATP-binding protein [Elainellaceae cyanobacterium]
MLDVQHISVQYRGNWALKEVSLSLKRGEMVGLIGPNGAGKSTLIKAILGLVTLSDGHVLLQNCPVRRQRQRIAYVPQRSQIDWDYPITAIDVVMLAKTATAGWLRGLSRGDRAIVNESLERVGMWNLRHRQIGELSGGQQQRIFLARALAQQADLFLLDEPFNGIDKKTEAIMMSLFAELQAQGKTLLICSHEWGETLHRYDRLVLLNQQILANDTPQAVMTLDNIQRAYGENMRPSVNEHVETFFSC